MAINTQIAADMAATVFDDTVDETPAESVVYTPIADSDNPLTIVVMWSSEDPYRAEDVPLGRSELRLAKVVIATADIAVPKVNDTIVRTETGEGWTVTEVDRIGSGAANTLTMKRSEPNERSREGYRVNLGSR